ncbi:coiled-coil domain-containing protein 12 [Pteropus vampyrus]|uniref:Coiled-coil domain-containing protein 12 n=1 Tax=Pteropus vampyrus TaxID=132908 RepID=A0A6P6BMM0_PTEVA|nr:coiled-coil domain-containing protein 12 [Pteropus vampyrus]
MGHCGGGRRKPTEPSLGVVLLASVPTGTGPSWVFTSGWPGARGEVRTRGPRVSPGTPACTVFAFAVSLRRVTGPLRRACLVVLHPLVEEKVKEQLEAAKPEPVIEEVDLANLAPRKPDWDLKRDVAKKLEKLEKRTQRAIAELIRERLKGQEDSLASAVDASTEQEACDSD